MIFDGVWRGRLELEGCSGAGGGLGVRILT